MSNNNQTYELRVHSDSYFNEDEGWTVNNGYWWDSEIQIPSDADNAKIIEILKAANFLDENCTIDDLSIEDQMTSIDINAKSDDCPICTLLIK